MKRNSAARRVSLHVALVVATCLVALFGAASAATATPGLPATVTGFVQTGGGVGIPNVYIRIDGETSVTTQAGYAGFSQETTTDATGHFVITDVVQGTYRMFVNDPGPTQVPGFAELTVWDGWEGSDPDTRHYISGGSTSNVATITLSPTGIVNGRALDGASPIEGCEVSAEISNGGVLYRRWSKTGADGRYSITDAPPGDWSVTMSGKGTEVPVGAVPYNWNEVNAVTASPADSFTLAAGATENRPATPYAVGRRLDVNAVEEYTGTVTSTYWLPGISVVLTDMGSDPDNRSVYYLATGDNGIATAYLPAGEYKLDVTDDAAYPSAYLPSDPVTFMVTAPGTTITRIVKMAPAPGTYAVQGLISEAGTGNGVASWITASFVDPSSPWVQWYRRVPSNGSGASYFMIRLPQSTGFTGNKVRLEISDQASPPDPPYVHVTKAFNVVGPSSITTNPVLAVGGQISGTIRDDVGEPVPGCTVWVTRKAFDPSLGMIAWVGADSWWTRTDVNGEYTLGGLPTTSDYKLNVVADYNPGMLLPIKYRDYYRRTYQGQPLVDSLNTSASPIGGVVDHKAVSVIAGHETTGIDETITPGGYVALHADGPAHPTGAVWCDVWYQYKGQWFEIDSGYTTGGTFAKNWKVLPTGTYRLDYNDFFGRGGGSLTFGLYPGQHKYLSVLVPAPVSILSGSSLVKGTFAGFLGTSDGLVDGGAGGTELKFALATSPSTVPAGTTGAGSTYNVTLTGGGSWVGIWTLTIPYDPSIPPADVPYLRVVHYKMDGTSEVLTPRSYNTITHTLQVQTRSLSPFRPVFRRHAVTLSTPTCTSSTWTRYHAKTVTGILKPRHTAGLKSVKLLIYRKNSAGVYKYYTYKWATNSNLYSYSRYSARFSLKAGKYRIYAYAPSDKWHTATKTKYYKSITVK